jgi:MFS family permease
MVLGVPGVLMAFVIRFTLKEPKRGAMDTHAPPVITHNWLSSIRTIMSSKPFVLIILGSAITNLGAGTLGAWGFALSMRAFHVTPTMVASIQSPLSALFGVTGTVLGGWGTTWVAKRFHSERWILLLPTLVYLPCFIGGFMYAWAPNWPIMIAGGLIGGFTIGFRTSPHLALSLNLVPANCRGMAAAANVIAASVVGQAGGPLVAGMISDAFAAKYGPVMALRLGMTFAPTTLLLGLIPLFIALKYFDKDGVKKEYAIA